MADTAQQVGGGLAVVDIIFTIVGFFYGAQVLLPIPMTYLSEIAFPLDLCVKLLSSLALFLLNTTHWVIDLWEGAAWHHRHAASPAAAVATTSQASHVFFQMLAWGTSTALLWMEHRRSRSPSSLLHIFWMANWIQVSIELFAHERVNQLDLGTPSTLVVVMVALTYSCSAILGASCFFTSTPVTASLIDLPIVTTPSAYLHSTNFKFPLSSYGTFGNYELISRNTSLALKPDPDDGDRDRNTLSVVSQASSHSHSVSRSGTLTATIPSSTTSIWGKNHFVSYKIVVRSDDDRWNVRRQYSDFVTLYDELPTVVRDACPLPSDDSERQYMSWKRKPSPMKIKLEKFLQRVLAHWAFEPYSSQALCDFLEMEYVDDELLRSTFSGPLTGSSWFAPSSVKRSEP